VKRPFVFVAIVGATIVQCTSSSPSDAGLDAETDAALACGPIDASVFVPDTMPPPHPPHLGKCTPQQVSDYAQCQGAKVTDLCGQFKPGQPAADCGACIETQHDAPEWGVVVFSGSTALFNIEGCVDDALGQVALEVPIDAGPTGGSCGDRLHWSYACQEAACNTCTGGDFTRCDSEVLSAGDDASPPGLCKPYDDLVSDPSSPCAPLFATPPPSDVANCFPDASITDAGPQLVDWLTRIATYMCGT
jgi:hypothetical protein